jgi:aminomethyltransferase
VTDADLRRSPLDAAHRALGARMVPFGGWEMPLSYPDGTLAEHRACRHGAVVFDVSHLGTVRVTGPGAFATLQRTLTNDLGRIDPGRAQYTHLLDADDGSVLDDIIVWWLDPEGFEVMPNASNTIPVSEALAAEAAGSGAGEVTAADVTAERALLAVQGPHARERLATVSAPAAAVARFGVVRVAWEGTELTVAGTGYTGEDGVEVSVPADRARDLWDAVAAAGITPAGLGARDTLRLEAGLPLHGHELGPGITPLQANLGWVVAWDKGAFRGRDALVAEKEAGVARRLRGLATDGRRPPREGSAVLRRGEVVGEVTSGNFSPELGHGIALAFLPPDAVADDELAVDVRGTEHPARVVALPFVHRAR